MPGSNGNVQMRLAESNVTELLSSGPPGMNGMPGAPGDNGTCDHDVEKRAVFEHVESPLQVSPVVQVKRVNQVNPLVRTIGRPY